MICGIALLLIGLFIILGSLGVIPVSFWKIFLWIIAVGFLVSGISSMFKKGFPNGLLSLSAGVLLILQLVNIIDIGFWPFVGVLAGIALIQLGIFYLMPYLRKRGSRFTWYRRY